MKNLGFNKDFLLDMMNPKINKYIYIYIKTNKVELIKGSKKFKKNLEEKERRSETQIHFTLRNEDGWERQTRTD